MRKLIAAAAALLCTGALAMAAPASPVPYPYTQPDGSVIILVNHGDEFESWTTCNGVLVERDADGYYRPVADTPALRLARRLAAQPRREEAARLQAEARASSISMGQKRFPVVLVEFPDLPFTTADAQNLFTRMLNEYGYAEEEATGSVKQYFEDNSAGQFQPVFDVYGPVAVSKSYKYYGQDVGSDRSAYATEAFYEACMQLDGKVDFSQYDNDGDGLVDNTFFYFAGHNQAEGAEAETIWPHQYSLYKYKAYIGDVRVYRYACSSEYKGSSGTTHAGIGTFCHEFSHALGLPDFYDTDGDTNGRATDLTYFSLMCSGNYLNSGRTPPCLTAVERQMLGWMGDFRELSESGNYSLGSISNNTVPYISPADVEGEYFMYEYRDATGWDRYLPQGLAIYHVDQSQNIVAPGLTARQAWDSHYVNRYGDHPCFYMVSSDAYSTTAWDRMVYPGRENVTTFVPVPWSGETLPCRMSDISVGSDAKFHMEFYSAARQLLGRVTDADGAPLEGVSIDIEAAAQGVAPSALVVSSRVRPRSAAYSALSDADGNFILPIPAEETASDFRVSASKDGYITRLAEVTLRRLTEQNFILRKYEDGVLGDLRKYPEGGSASGIGFSDKRKNLMGAVHFSQAELQQWGGMYLQTVTFRYAENSPNTAKAYVIVDQGGERVLNREVDGAAPYADITVDIRDAGIRILPGKDLYIGYALENVNAEYPLLKKSLIGAKDAFNFASFNLTKSSWNTSSDNAILVSATLVDEDAQQGITLSRMGYSSIANPGSYAAGVPFRFVLEASIYNQPESVQWFYDGAPQTADQVALTSGHHRIRAVLTYADGASETLVLEIDVP